MLRISIVAAATLLGGCAGAPPAAETPPPAPPAPPAHVDAPRLGNFSVSLAVRDLAASRAFYEKLGLRMVAGDGKGWVVLQNASCSIGLFQGMFEGNILTFNPGWDRDKNTLADFDDVRDVQRVLRARGIEPVLAADESTTGPASFVIVDPDGNQILFDQHVPHP